MVYINQVDYAPSKNLFGAEDLIVLGSANKFEEIKESQCTIVTIKEPILFQRQINFTEKHEKYDDNIYKQNIPNIYNDSEVAQYRENKILCFLPESINLLLFLKPDDLHKIEQCDVQMFCEKMISDIVREYGAGTRLIQDNNDFLINGKKFFGEEFVSDRDRGFYVGSIITLYFNEYKKLYNKYIPEGTSIKQVGGLCDEMPEITPDALKKKLIENIKKFFNERNVNFTI